MITAQLSEAEKAACRALMRVVFALPREVSADLVDAGGLGLTEHLVLQNLLGAARLEQAHPAHAASIRRRVFDRLADCDPAAFTTWLESIAGQESPRSVRKI